MAAIAGWLPKAEILEATPLRTLASIGRLAK
jgi:hypothetical protein